MKHTETTLANNAHLVNARNKDLSNLMDSLNSKDEIYVPLLMHNFDLTMLIAFSDEVKYYKVIEFIEKHF